MLAYLALLTLWRFSRLIMGKPFPMLYKPFQQEASHNFWPLFPQHVREKRASRRSHRMNQADKRKDSGLEVGKYIVCYVLVCLCVLLF